MSISPTQSKELHKIDGVSKLNRNIKIRTKQEIQSHLNDSLTALETNIFNYNNGDQTAWLAIATQLHVLLCNKIEGFALIERVIHNFSLHPLLIEMSGKETLFLMSAPGIEVKNGKIKLKLFDFSKSAIPLGLWLKQTIMIMNYRGQGSSNYHRGTYPRSI